MRIAYIAQGKLHILEGQDKPRLIESRFAQDVIERSQRIAENRAWRSGGGSGMWGNANVWNQRNDFDPTAIKISFSDVTAGGSPDEILYCLQTDRVCGMFSYQLDSCQETRLFHKNDFHLGDIHRHTQQPLVIASLEKANGISNLVLFDGDSPHYREITDGDSRDEAPWWVPGEGKCVLYQSAGVGRNGAGHVLGYGPSALMELDLTSGKLRTLVESDRHDLLQPRRTPEGELVFIRRPWRRDPWSQNRLWKQLTDLVLFPYRLGRAIIDYLNVFSLMYSRKPLKTAGGPPGKEEDVSKAMLRGRVLDVQKALRQFQSAKETPALVPRSWQLVKRSPEGVESLLAEGVSAFDLCENGDICYTNGTGIFRLGSQGGPERLARDWLVDRVIAL